MAQIFHPSTNTIARVSIFVIVILLGVRLWLVAAISRSSYVTQAGVVREQPVPLVISIMWVDSASIAVVVMPRLKNQVSLACRRRRPA
jgi:hypothetical protein